MHRPKILVVTDRIPIDSSMPGAPRIFELCNALKDEYEFSLYLVSDKARVIPESAKALFSPIETHFFLPVLRLRHPLKKLLRRFSPTSSFDYRITHYSSVKKIQRSIDLNFSENNFDAIFVDGLTSSQFISSRLRNNAVLDLCDCLTKLQLRALRKSDSLRIFCGSLLSTVGTWFWERSTLRAFANVLIISNDDLAPLKALNCQYKAPTLVPLGVNLEYFESKQPIPKTLSIIFFGALSYQPNIDACTWLVEDIFPLIKKEFPDCTLTLAGSRPDEQILSLIKGSPGIKIQKDLPDIRPLIEEHSVVVSPMRLGAGVKNKLLVAISMKRPVISTSIGLEGINSDLAGRIKTANTAKEFLHETAKIFDSLSSEAKYHQLEMETESLKLSLSKYYSWEAAASPLREVLRSMTSKPNS